MPICTICGQETVFIPQYQQWYCHYCRTYPYMQQAAPAYAQPVYQTAYPGYYQPAPPYPAYAPAHYAQYYQPAPAYQQPQPVYHQPPAVAPNPVNARNRMYGSFMMRQSSDQAISTSWAWIILIFQIILPISAIITLVALVEGTSLDSAVGFFLAFILGLLLISIGLAASHGYLAYRLVKRRDDHFRRDMALREGMAEYLGAVALAQNVDLNVERWTLNTLHYTGQAGERGAGTWAVLIALIPLIPFVGIIFLLYTQYFLTKDMQEHDEKQRSFNYQYHMGLAKAGKAGGESFVWNPLPRRDLAVYIILTILTLGLFLPYWWYVNIKDMNEHMANQWKFEEALVRLLQADGR